jgi:hypothetical protein
MSDLAFIPIEVQFQVSGQKAGNFFAHLLGQSFGANDAYGYIIGITEELDSRVSGIVKEIPRGLEDLLIEVFQFVFEAFSQFWVGFALPQELSALV